MKVEITYVPKGKDLIEFFEELNQKGELKNSWIFIDNEMRDKMVDNGNIGTLYTRAMGERFSSWDHVEKISYYVDEAITVISAPEEPENIFILKREE